MYVKYQWKGGEKKIPTIPNTQNIDFRVLEIRRPYPHLTYITQTVHSNLMLTIPFMTS